MNKEIYISPIKPLNGFYYGHIIGGESEFFVYPFSFALPDTESLLKKQFNIEYNFEYVPIHNAKSIFLVAQCILSEEEMFFLKCKL
jgi:hypothetical protein